MAFKKPTIHQIVPDIKNASVYLRGEPKTGKAQPVSEPVLTANGWTPMGDIKVGDYVFGEDGELHEVKGVYPQGVKDVYEVTFSDGSSTRCGLEHLWLVQDGSKEVVKSLKEIMEDYKGSDDDGHVVYSYWIHEITPIQFEHHELPIDPFVLGLLIDNGILTDYNETISLLGDPKVSSYLYGIGLQHGMKVFKPELKDQSMPLYVPDSARSVKNTLYDDIRELYDYENELDYIPDLYMYSSIADRINLLKGIIINGGYLMADGNRKSCWWKYYASNERLANQVADLVRSLGLFCFIEKDNGGDNCCVLIYVTNRYLRFGLPVGDYDPDLTPNRMARVLVDIQLVGQEECRCLYVDNPSHLYITKDYIPTHNTTLFRDVILEKYHDPEKGLLIKCGAESGDTMLDEVNSVQVETWDEVKELAEWLIGQKGKEHNIEIIAFDTVDELIKMAEEEAKKISYKESRDTGKPVKPRSINQAFGGYSKGPAYVTNELLTPLISKLKQHFGLWGIAHTKMKTSSKNVDSLNSEVAVQQLTSNLDSRYEACFGGLLDIIVTGAFENNEIIGSTMKGVGSHKKEVTLVDPTKQKRKFYFRSTAFVDAGSRFADYAEIPESMEYKLNHNNARDFIDIVELGMEKSKLKYRHTNNNIAESASEPESLPEVKKEVDFEEDPAVVLDEEPPAEEGPSLYDQAIAKFKACQDRDLKLKVKEISGGPVNRNTSDEVLKAILELLG